MKHPNSLSTQTPRDRTAAGIIKTQAAACWRGMIATLPVLALLATLAGLWPGTAAAADRGDPPDELIFESRAPGSAGGGLSISSNFLNGHTFRVQERTQVTRVGTHLQAFSAQTVYMALYQVGTPVSAPDVVNDSRLLGAGLIDVPAGGPYELSAPLSVTLEPGWYSVMVGTGRHGATAPIFSVTVANAGTEETPQSFGPYTVSVSTNALSLQGTQTRYFVRGYTLPPEPVPDTQFLMESARPSAWTPWSAANISSTQFIGTRFSTDRTVRIDAVDAWLTPNTDAGAGAGASTIFAAILPLASATSMPPRPDTPAFGANALGYALIPVPGRWDSASGAFDDLTLPPGHYALVFGSGRFGASGTSGLITVADEIVHPDTILQVGTSSWFPYTSYTFMMRLRGIVPELEIQPDPVDFGSVPLTGNASHSVTITNLRDTGELNISALDLIGDDAAHFAIDDDADDCLIIAAGSQCSFTLHYDADILGSHVAMLAVNSDGVPSPALVTINGETVPSALVTPSVIGSGSIDPDDPQLVATGSSAAFTLTPATGHHLQSVDGSCGGSLVGTVFTTDPVESDCSVAATFAINTYTVTASAGANGSIDPSGSQTVDHGDSRSFTLVADLGHHIESVTGSCGGSLDGAVFTTQAVTADCTVIASFAIDTFTINASAGANGSIDPSGPQALDYGSTLAFTLHPDNGYQIDGVDSDCGGSLDGFVYTTAPVTSDCALLAQFALEPATSLSVVSGAGQSTPVDSAFPSPVVLRVSNGAGLPVPDVVVTLQAPEEGSSASVAVSLISDGSGEVAVLATANTIAGTYAIQATAAGVADPVPFELTNLAGPPDQIQAIAGSGQASLVGTPFADDLRVRVLDAFDNPVPGIEVTYMAPPNGASAVLDSLLVTTDTAGVASVGASANAVPGDYEVEAIPAGVTSVAAFALENRAPVLQLGIGIDDGLDHVAYGQTADYLITISNSGSDDATGVDVLVPLPIQLDADVAEWYCLDAASGCSASGSGALSDGGILVPADGSVRYVLNAPVLPDAPGERIETEAFAESPYHAPIMGADFTWLVLFRNGLEVDTSADDEGVDTSSNTQRSSHD